MPSAYLLVEVQTLRVTPDEPRGLPNGRNLGRSVGSYEVYQCFITHMLHVWIFLPTFCPKNNPNVGKYTIHGASG